jgi:dienelactone hydrolase
MLRLKAGRTVALACALLSLPACRSAVDSAGGRGEFLQISYQRDGKTVAVEGELFLPPGTGRVPAMVIHHGSNGVIPGHESRYARELNAMGVAALVLDSFRGRGVTSTIPDQELVSNSEMTQDAFQALRLLSIHPRIRFDRIGIMGFSKGGYIAIRTALEEQAARRSNPGLRFALHVPFYPGCSEFRRDLRPAGGLIHMLLGGADAYTGTSSCLELAAKLRKAGADVKVTVYAGAAHSFDGHIVYDLPKGQNWSRCIFVEEPDGSWLERTSGLLTERNGGRIPEAYEQAVATCMTFGVSGSPNADARSQSLEALKSAVRRRLLR